MKLVKKTLEYLFVLERGKRFLVLFIAALPFGLCAAFTLDGGAALKWISDYATHANGFSTAWHMGLSPLRTLFWHSVTGVVLVPTLAFLGSVISRNMRVGAFRTDRIGRELNESFFPALTMTVLYIVFYLATRLLLTLFVLLWGRMGTLWLSAGLTALTAFIFIFLMGLLTEYNLLYFPIMVIQGITSTHAFGTAFNRMNLKFGQLTLAVAVPIFLKIVASFLLHFIKIPAVSYVLDGALNAFLLVYLGTASFVAYYESTSLERNDYTREYYYRKK